MNNTFNTLGYSINLSMQDYIRLVIDVTRQGWNQTNNESLEYSVFQSLDGQKTLYLFKTANTFSAGWIGDEALETPAKIVEWVNS